MLDYIIILDYNPGSHEGVLIKFKYYSLLMTNIKTLKAFDFYTYLYLKKKDRIKPFQLSYFKSKEIFHFCGSNPIYIWSHLNLDGI